MIEFAAKAIRWLIRTKYDFTHGYAATSTDIAAVLTMADLLDAENQASCSSTP
jgi:hypothetical protein